MSWADGMKNSEGEIRDGALSLLNKDIADVSTIFNDACLVSVCAYDMDSIIDAADSASIINHDNVSVAKSASIIDNVNLTAAKAASIIDSVNLTAAKAASIIDDTNLTVAKLISILDNGNITSSKIKSIFETGNLSVDAKRASVIEGDQYTAADAATSVNGAFYTDDQLALAFDNANLTAAKAASIIDNANLTVSKAASIFDNTNLTVSKAASIFDEFGLSITKINSIITHANITDNKAQEILNGTTYATRDLTSATSIIYALCDDWDDNKLTSRDDRDTTASSLLGANEFAQKFRPDWTVDDSPSGLTIIVDTGRVKFSCTSGNSGAGYIQIPSVIIEGTWEWKYQYSQIFSGNTGVDNLYFMHVDDNNAYYIQFAAYGGYGDFYKVVGGADTKILECSLVVDTDEHIVKVTRNSSGNFEVFQDDVSKGTAIDNDITSSNHFRQSFEDYKQTFDYYLDDLKIY